MSIKTTTRPIAAVILLATLILPTGCKRLNGKSHAAKHHKKDSQIADKQRSCTCKVSSSPTHTRTPNVVVASQEIDD